MEITEKEALRRFSELTLKWQYAEWFLHNFSPRGKQRRDLKQQIAALRAEAGEYALDVLQESKAVR